jgi:penicillin V acylase-like amidase (Ntn superfamily)
MSTAVTLSSLEGRPCLGRTMDSPHPLDPALFYLPRNASWHSLLAGRLIRNRYAVLGCGQAAEPAALADGVNEEGLGAAALYFPGYAVYGPQTDPNTRGLPVDARELVSFLLSQCATVEEASAALSDIQIMGGKDASGAFLPLHWILADTSGACLTVEKTENGQQQIVNTVGVLSNSPDFFWQTANLRNYLRLTPEQPPRSVWGTFSLTPFGLGAGTSGLPGDYTSPSRFVRAAYLKNHLIPPIDDMDTVRAGFHVLDSVSIPKGAVRTSRGEYDYTQYTIMIHLSSREYFYKTYDNSQVSSLKMQDLPDTGKTLLLQKLI